MRYPVTLVEMHSDASHLPISRALVAIVGPRRAVRHSLITGQHTQRQSSHVEAVHAVGKCHTGVTWWQRWRCEAATHTHDQKLE